MRGRARAAGGTGQRESMNERLTAMSRALVLPPPFSLRSAATAPTPCIHMWTPTLATRLTHVTEWASPFSSSCSHAQPAGAAFQFTLVGPPGGVAVRVCQGAPVQAESLGRCWVRLSCVHPRRAMGHMAGMAGGHPAGGAMVVRDGADGSTAIADTAIDTVAGTQKSATSVVPSAVARALTPPPTPHILRITITPCFALNPRLSVSCCAPVAAPQLAIATYISMMSGPAAGLT